MSKWEWKKLGEVAKIYNGNSINANVKKERYSNVESGFPFIATKDVGNDSEVDYENGIRIPFEEAGFKVARKDTVLICAEGGSAGKKKCILNEDVCFGNKLFAIDYNREKLIGKFVFYYTFEQSFTDEFQKLLSGIIGGVSSAKFKEIQIPIPPLSEQKRIVKFLDNEFSKIETLKTNAETNLKNAKELFYAELKKSFHEKGSWKTVQLGEIALEYGRGKSKHRPRNDECLFGGEYPFIQTGDIRNSGKYVVDYTETYNEIGLAQSKLWQKGTLCITIAANIAETAILTFPCCFPDSVIGFVPNEQYSSVDFIYYVILYFRTELQKISKGAAQDNLNLAKLESMNFPLPPLSVQKEIVARLDKLSENVKRLETNYKQIIANCDELKKSILEKTFEEES
jgi:type I restriction enzyme S subunit